MLHIFLWICYTLRCYNLIHNAGKPVWWDLIEKRQVKRELTTLPWVIENLLDTKYHYLAVWVIEN